MSGSAFHSCGIGAHACGVLCDAVGRLHFAVGSGCDIRIVRLLLARRFHADPNARTLRKRHTALHFCAQAGLTEPVEILRNNFFRSNALVVPAL